MTAICAHPQSSATCEDATTIESDSLFSLLIAMNGSDIRAAAMAYRHGRDTATGELAWWKATFVVEGLLRARRRSVIAATAGDRAVRAVQSAARIGGLAPDDPDVTTVARAARDIARAIASGPQAAVAVREMTRDLLPLLESRAAA
jgi:hypothetical protein